MDKRVLLIEPNVPSMELMFHLLTTYGYLPLRASNGEEGLKLAARERPKLIVSDVMMPLLDGYEVARRVRADPNLSAIPMIALNAFEWMPDDRRKALDAGFDGYMSKPISPQSFMRHVETFLRPGFRAGTALVSVSASADAAAKPAGRKVLVVDDTAANLQLASIVLGRAGYQVVTAKGMAEALRLARQDPPDLFLSDIVMADGSGYEFIRAVKGDGRLSDIPFVFNTSSMTVDSARAKCMALGAAKVLFRPMPHAEMLREIEACLGAR